MAPLMPLFLFFRNYSETVIIQYYITLMAQIMNEIMQYKNSHRGYDSLFNL